MSEFIKYGRKVNGIKKELYTKVEEWLDSITDIDVQTLARKNVIVTGGSIASMLLGEKINDFDVYFRDKKTTLAIAHYYADLFNEMNKGFRPYIVQVREDVKENARGVIEDRVIMYIKSAGVAEETEKSKDSGKKYRPVFLSENAITLSDKVQLVTRFYGEPDEIHDNYDYIHAMCYWDHATKDLVMPTEALQSLMSRKLTYVGSLYPVASLFRMRKFLYRGWHIGIDDLVNISMQISALDLTNYQTLKEQLTGVDALYLLALIQALKGVDTEDLTTDYVISVVKRVFNNAWEEDIDEQDDEIQE